MAKALVVVDSLGKAKTLGRWLGADALVRTCSGDARGLPKTRLGIDPARGFAAEYEVPSARRKDVAAVAAAAQGTSSIHVAAPPGPEGEAYCWHLAEALRRPLQSIRRVVLTELTEAGVRTAFQHARAVDVRTVAAEQARRLLDRLVRGTLGPFLAERTSGVSLGRREVLALALVCERDETIRSFQAEECWTALGHFRRDAALTFTARLLEADGRALVLPGVEQAIAVRTDLETAVLRVRSVGASIRTQAPPPPFLTSTLLCEASSVLALSPSQTLRLADRLHEGIEMPNGREGLITSPRTGDREPIGPTSSAWNPAVVEPHLSRGESALYRLVWERFVKSQGGPAVVRETVVELGARTPSPSRPAGHDRRERGYRLGLSESQCPNEGSTESALFPVAEGEVLKLERVDLERRLTEAPRRFGEASLVRELAEQALAPAIPSAAAVQLLTEAGLVEIVAGTIRPSRRGTQAFGLLTEHFPDLVSRERAAALEERAEAVARGEESLLGLLGTFWRTLPRDPGRARSRRKALDGDGVARACERCGLPMIEREGPYGRFLACSGYPSCRKTLGPDGNAGSEEVGLLCPRCSAAPIVERRSRSGRAFYGCRAYPLCRFTTHHRPRAEPCPACGHAFLLEKQTRRDERIVFCGSCTYERDARVPASIPEAPDSSESGRASREHPRPWSGTSRVVK